MATRLRRLVTTVASAPPARRGNKGDSQFVIDRRRWREEVHRQRKVFQAELADAARARAEKRAEEEAHVAALRQARTEDKRRQMEAREQQRAELQRKSSAKVVEFKQQNVAKVLEREGRVRARVQKQVSRMAAQSGGWVTTEDDVEALVTPHIFHTVASPVREEPTKRTFAVDEALSGRSDDATVINQVASPDLPVWLQNAPLGATAGGGPGDKSS